MLFYISCQKPYKFMFFYTVDGMFDKGDDERMQHLQLLPPAPPKNDERASVRMTQALSISNIRSLRLWLNTCAGPPLSFIPSMVRAGPLPLSIGAYGTPMGPQWDLQWDPNETL